MSSSTDDLLKIDGWIVHRKVTVQRVMAAAMEQATTLANPGFCLHCGAELEGFEPDARRCECELCSADAVHGAADLLEMMPAIR